IHRLEPDLTPREYMVLELFANEKDCTPGLLLLDEIFKKSLLDEIRDNKKLSKHEKEFIALVEPILRVAPVHGELVITLQMRLEQGTDRIGDIIKDKVQPSHTPLPRHFLSPINFATYLLSL